MLIVQTSPIRSVHNGQNCPKELSRIIIPERGSNAGFARQLHHDLRQVLSGIGSDLEDAVRRQIEGKEVKTGLESLRTLSEGSGIAYDRAFKNWNAHISLPLWRTWHLGYYFLALREFQETYSDISIEKQTSIFKKIKYLTFEDNDLQNHYGML